VSDDTLALLLVLGFVAVVARAVYKVGYQKGRDDALNPPHLRPLTEDQRTEMLMRVTLSRSRRFLGWAAIGIPILLFPVFLFAVMQYGICSKYRHAPDTCRFSSLRWRRGWQAT
jgi:hypothetical protein